MPPRRPIVPTGLKIVAIFVGIPLIELVLLVWLTGLTSLWFTIGLIVVSGILGGIMAKSQGFYILHRTQTELAMGRFPGDSILDGLIVLFGAALLLTPGVLTDFVGFAALLPPVRAALRPLLRRAFGGHFKTHVHRGAGGFSFHARTGAFRPPHGGPSPPGQPGSPKPEAVPSEAEEEDNDEKRTPFDKPSPFDKLKHR